MSDNKQSGKWCHLVHSIPVVPYHQLFIEQACPHSFLLI